MIVLRIIVFVISLILAISGLFIVTGGILNPEVTKGQLLTVMVGWIYTITVAIVTAPKD